MTEPIKLAGARVLVAGGAGFVGTNLINRLVSLGADVTATIHNNAPQVLQPNVNYIECDLLKADECRRAVSGQTYVFMCAANTSGAAVIEGDPLAHFAPNVIMNVSMLDAAYQSGVEKFLFISSNVVYPVMETPAREGDVSNNFFEKYFVAGWMKRFSEIACDTYSRKGKAGMKICVVRPGNIYGEYDDFEEETSHVIPALIRKVVERQAPLEVWGDGRDVKDFIYIEDFVTGMISVMEKVDSSDPINIAAGTSVSIREVLGLLLRAHDYTDAEVTYLTSKPTMIPKRLIDISKARDLLGFEPRVSLKEGLKRTMQWYKEQVEEHRRRA